MTLQVRPHTEGAILPVKARPGARRAGLAGIHNGMLKVSVTAAPERGKANEALIDVLCEELLLARSQVELLAGATSRQKQFLVRGLAADELSRRIANVLAHETK